MKKFYAILLAAVVALSASAFDLTKHAGRTVANTKFGSLHKSGTAGISMKKLNKISRAGEGEFTLDEFVGDWEWMYFDLFSEDEDPQSFITTISVADEDEGLLLLDNFIEEGLVAYAYADLENGALIIPSCVILPEFDEGVDAVFTTFAFDYDDEGYIDPESIHATPNAPFVLFYEPDEEMLFNFEDMYGVACAIDGEVIDEMDSWLVLLFQSMLVPYEVYEEPDDIVEDPADYQVVGIAELTDGWLYPAFKIAQADYAYEVTLEKSIKEEGVYRLADPYSPLGEHIVAAYYNESKEPGYIKFNIADPMLPYVYTNIYSGFKSAIIPGKMYMFDLTGYFVDYIGEPANYHYLAVQHGEAGLSKYDEETRTINIPNSYFGIEGDKFSPYSWRNADTSSAIRIVTDNSSIDSVVATAEGKNVEFYNLQGIRVENPVKGNIYIMRQGNEAKKVIR